MEPHVNLSVVVRGRRWWVNAGWYRLDPWKLLEVRLLDSGFGFGLDLLMVQVLKFSVGFGFFEVGEL